MIEKICRECGGQVIDLVLACYPPIYQSKCSGCGRIISEERDKIVRQEV